MLWRYIVALGVVLLVYLCLGGLGFHLIESSNETHIMSNQRDVFDRFIANFSCVPPVELEMLLRGMLTAYDSGVLVLPNSSSLSNWDYASSIFFSLTVVTTIGYGHISPSTQAGQAFFVVYALLGIPLCGAFVFSIGAKFKKVLENLLDKSCSSNHKKAEKILKVLLFIASCLLVLLFLPALIFMLIENWTYSESLYYCVVTMTTVGFGDYVPGQQSETHRALYHILVVVWILVGCAWLAIFISTATDHVVGMENRIKDKCKKGNEKKKVTEVKDDKITTL